jgi:hypothetical protein
MELKIMKSKKTRELETPPEFSKTEVIFHPLPKAYQELYKPGESVIGEYGIKRDTGVNDVRGVRIAIQYFIPSA